MDGRADQATLRRVRVQARQAYVYAHAGALGWHDRAKDVSDHFWAYLIGPGFQPKTDTFNGCAFLLNPDGSLNDDFRDTYSHAFVILAGAWRYIAFKDEQSLEIAKATLDFLDTNMAADNGGWHEGLPANFPRRQNPHMHMFEALMALYDATSDKQYLDRATDVFDLFKQYFFNPNHGTIVEFFNADWSRADNNGGPLEPGHMMEWCWLLRQYQDRTGCNVDQYADALFNTATDFGLHPQMELLHDTVLEEERRGSGTFRTWPQTEHLKACIAQAQTGRPDAVGRAVNCLETLFARYLAVSKQGGWADQIDTDGLMISSTMPSSTFYHLFSACAEVAGFRKSLEP